VNPLHHNVAEKSGLTSVNATIRWLLSRLTAFVEEPDDDSDTDSVSSVNAFGSDGTNGNGSSSTEPSFINMQSQSLQSPTEEGHERDMPIPVDPHFESLSTQYTGFNGRPNKIADTCYAFWVGGALDVCAFSFCNMRCSLS